MSFQLKIVLIGPGAVGKTAILNRYVNDDFDENYQLTVGVDFLGKLVVLDSGELAKLSIWDIGGQERFETIRTTFYRGAHGTLLVFDLTRNNTFEAMKTWLDEIRKSTDNPDLPFLLIGNKLDLLEETGEVVDRGEAKSFAENEGGVYIETSAKTGVNVHEAFSKLLNNILK